MLSADEPLAKLKDALKQRGTHGIISLGHKFRSIDDDGDNKLSEWRWPAGQGACLRELWCAVVPVHQLAPRPLIENRRL